MAETVVSSLIDRLVPLLTQEAKQLRGIHGEVADIKDELDIIQSFLKDADARAAAEEDNSEGVKTWVKQVREVAIRIDVAIDQYLLQVAQHGPHRPDSNEIQEIKASVQKIKARSERYGFQSTGQGSGSNAPKARWYNPRNDSLYLDDIDVVGIEVPRDRLIGWLVKGPPHRIVVSVVGMGGLSKTTLAKKVYDHQTVRGHFDCHAWISVSQSYNIEDLLRSMIKQFCEVKKELPPVGVDTMDEVSLNKNLRDYLQQKRYVVVFDDLQPVSPEKAWELFCKRAFRFDFGGQCPTELEKLSREIVKKCQGLPLANTTIGGLLSTKNKTLFEWRNLHDNLGFELGRNPYLAGVNKVLSLSFEDLPYHLKSCLLYFGMYPESFGIPSIRLIRQWIVEGFVNKINDKALEDIAREYLTELISRSLVQVLEVAFGEVATCRIHDILHEIIQQKMEDLCFGHIDGQELHQDDSVMVFSSSGGSSYGDPGRG
ncbi:disease resistance protein RPM1-like [Quercus lobata]|uniref:disease resistance protein RPM1-like n=1 Tax=Quercus lobata TaxID=97700 RepID=UPI0012483131|nr:disease resistance protein RPM1-like [Quercus lobata]